jgi:hypothetical protein
LRRLGRLLEPGDRVGRERVEPGGVFQHPVVAGAPFMGERIELRTSSGPDLLWHVET